MLLDVAINTNKLEEIKQNIQKHSPHPHKVHIIAVTKTFSFTALQSAIKHNLFHIGESRAQETQKKIQNNTLHPQTRLHLIGHLQSNKAALAVKLYDVIQSVDSLKLLKKINVSAKKRTKQQVVFLQINITKAQTQKGFYKEDIMSAAEIATQLNYIKLGGIMSIGAHTTNKERITKGFETAQHKNQFH